MELPHTLKVLEECQISPPSGSVPPSSLPLTYFDLVFLSHGPVENLLFYELHHTTSQFLNTILPNIKNSLSLTLQHFYPLAGNLKWPQESILPQLVYKDGDAVLLTVAESAHNFDQFVGNHTQDLSLFCPLIPKIKCITSGEKHVPLMALQVTLFPNKGICIGTSIHHAVADGRTVHEYFFKSWASVCRLEGDKSLTTDLFQSYKRFIGKGRMDPYTLMNTLETFGLTSRETFHILRKDDVVPIDQVRSSFVMGSTDIKRLKQWISTDLEKEDETVAPLRLSSVVATCAYVWVCLIKARSNSETSDGAEAIERFMVPIDVRARLDPPLPINNFGNCITFADATAKRTDLTGENGILIAAKLIRRAIQDFDINKQLEKDITYYMSVPPAQVFHIAGSPRFRDYETDFGLGKPKKFVIASAVGQVLSLADSPNEEGAIEIGVARSKIEIDAFASLFANSLGAVLM